MLRLLIRSVVVCLLAGFFAGAHEDSPPDVSLHFAVDNDGKAWAWASLGFEPEGFDIHRALGEALSCEVSEKDSSSHDDRWYFNIGCEEAFRRQGLEVAGRIDLSPLKSIILRAEVESAEFHLNHPTAGFTFTVPKMEPTNEYGYSNYSIDSGELPGIVVFRFGYQREQVIQHGIFTLGVLLGPPLIAFVLARRTLSRHDAEGGAVWFPFQRSLIFVVLGGFAVWWGGVAYFRLANLPSFLLWTGPYDGPAIHFLRNAIWLIVPALAAILTGGVSQPVARVVGGQEWTLRETLVQQTLVFGIIVIPTACVFTGVQHMFYPDYRQAALWIVAAVVTVVLLMSRVKESTGFTPEPLTTGELRDRAFELAAQAGVKLRQLYILPTGKARMANAFAMGSGGIAISESLVEKLNRREIDSVIGHELSHLKGRHGWWNLLFVPVVLAVPTAVTMKLWPGAIPVWAYGALLLVAVVLLLSQVSRRLEHTADAAAVKLTADPEAFITAQKKITALNLLPMEWSKRLEMVLSHPSSRRRIEAAARKAGIPAERVEEILRSPETEEEHYALPSTGKQGSKVLSSSRRTAMILRKFLVEAIALLTPLSLGVMAANHWSLGGWSSAVFFAVVAVVTVGGVLLVARWEPFLGLDSVAERLRQKFIADGVPMEGIESLPVGLSPGTEARFFENTPYWDVGYLLLTRDRLSFAGEETSFSIPRDQISAIETRYTVPRWWPEYQVVVRWRDPVTEADQAFHAGPLAQPSLKELFHGKRKLEQRLAGWRNGEATGETPTALASLPTPRFGEVTGLPAAEMASIPNMGGVLLQTVYSRSRIDGGVGLGRERTAARKTTQLLRRRILVNRQLTMTVRAMKQHSLHRGFEWAPQ